MIGVRPPMLRACLKNGFAGSTGDSPVPSGDSPDGMVRANGDSLFATLLAAVPVGGSPTGAGGSLQVARATHFQNKLLARKAGDIDLNREGAEAERPVRARFPSRIEPAPWTYKH